MAPLTLVALPVVGILFIFTMPVITSDFEEIETLIEEHYKFAIELHHVMREANKNIVVSPITTQIVLALTFVGAKSNTKVQIANALHFPNNIEAVLEELKMLIEYLRDPASDLNFVATMFLEKSLDMKTRFLDRVSKYFPSNVGYVNFGADPKGARGVINHWVDERSNNKFMNFLGEGAINSNTRLLHASAFFFKKEWETEFDDILPDSDFHVTPDKKVKVTMLYQNDMFPCKYLPELKAKILDLPFDNREFKMIIILPDEINGLTEVENKLPTLNLAEIVASFKEVAVDIKLPIFNFDKRTDMRGFLRQLGIKDLFDSDKANINGIAKDLYAHAFDQRIFLEVNEKDAEAAPASSYSRRNMHKEYFIADHPFLFFIYYNKVPLMIGSINGF